MLVEHKGPKGIDLEGRVLFKPLLPRRVTVRAAETRVVHYSPEADCEGPPSLWQAALQQQAACPFDRKPVLALSTPVCLWQLNKILCVMC